MHGADQEELTPTLWTRTKRCASSPCVFALAVLSACSLAQVEPLDLPAEVSDYLPADIDMSEVNRDPDGCYFYTYGASLFIVQDNNGNPVCLPETPDTNA